MPEARLNYYQPPYHVVSYILEDDNEDAEDVEKIFRENDFGEYHRFSKGSLLLKEVHDHRVDVFIADLRGIDLDGLTAMLEVKKKWPLCYFILITQYVTNEVVDKAVNSIGVRKYVNKNFKNWCDVLKEFIAEGVKIAQDEIAFITRMKERIMNLEKRLEEKHNDTL